MLIRALELLDGIDKMQLRRCAATLRDLARGPVRLAAALGIDRDLDGIDLCREGPLWLGRGASGVLEVGVSKRTGLSREVDRPFRFHLRGSAFGNGPVSLNR